jgi:hypothetical protein
MQALVRETEKMISTVEGNDLRDAALIASAQRRRSMKSPPSALLQRLRASWALGTIGRFRYKRG